MPLENRSRLGHYDLLAPLGSGGMGEVFRARDVRLDREVAVKVLSKRLERDADAIARFEREAKAVASLSHPNILAIHDFAVEDGRPYTVTELLDGQSLRERIGEGPMPWREAATLGVAIAEGLSAAHAKGVVHRDLKPENLFLTRDGRLKILDFGLAQTEQEAFASSRTLEASAPTVATPIDSGVVMGTIGYMSPEQARGRTVGPPSDLFSLGCVLYELVTGRRAFERAAPTDTMAAVLNDAPAPISESGRHVPPELARVILHCLEKDPAKRFQSARDTGFALQAVLNDSSVEIGQARSRTRGVRAVAVLPFENASGDAELDYVSDGLTENLINELAQIPRLRVIPRAVVFKYKGRAVDAGTVAVELNATTLITGRVAARGDQLSVQAEMIEVASESQLWGQRYVRPTADLFALQETLADEIADALRGKLSRKRAQKRKAAHKPNAPAYEQYLRARHFFNRWTADGFNRAIQHFDAAITIDPAFALAWAGLAEALGAAGYFGFLPAAEAMPRAGMAAEHAIRLDDSLADGHAVLGLGLLFWRWDFARAGEAFRTAVDRNPRHALARVYRTLYLISQRRMDEALAESREAERLDPVSPVTAMSVAWALHFSGQTDDLIAQLYRLLDLDPTSIHGHAMLAAVFESRGDFEGALRHLASWCSAAGQSPDAVDLLRTALREGRDSYWRTRLALLEQGLYCGGPAVFAYADVYIRLGEYDRALDHLERACEERQGAMVFAAAEPAFAPLHAYPRFQALLDRVGLTHDVSALQSPSE